MFNSLSSQGSVEVIYEVTFEESSSVTPDQLTETMKSYLSNNNYRIGGYKIENNSVEHSGEILTFIFQDYVDKMLSFC